MPVIADIAILLVEDNPTNAALVQAHLEEPGSRQQFHITCVETLREALLLLSEQTFDIVLLDLTLPDSHGVETVQRVRMASSQTPVVVLTSVADEELGLAAVRSGAQDCLLKTELTAALLRRAITYALERQHLEQRLNKALRKATLTRAASSLARSASKLLSVVVGNAEQVLRQPPGPEALPGMVEEIRRAGDRASALIGVLLALHQQDTKRPVGVQLPVLLTRLEPLLRSLLGQGVTFDLQMAPSTPPAVLDPRELERLLTVLTLQAHDQLPAGSQVLMRTGTGLLEGRVAAVVTFLCRGAHLDGQSLRQLLEPFFPANEARGQVEIVTDEEDETSIILRLPAHACARVPALLV